MSPDLYIRTRVAYIPIGVSPVGKPRTESGLLNTWRATIRAASRLIP